MNIIIYNDCQFAQNPDPVRYKTFHFQDNLLSAGLDIGASLTGDYFYNVSGGIKKQDCFFDNIILNLSLDADRLLGLNNMTFYISGIAIGGGSFNENTGAMQGVSNISGVNHVKLYEFWIEQTLFSDNLSILFGLYDLNSEFDVRESSGTFINPSFGIGYDFAQSGLNGPSIFPYTSIALRIKYQITPSLKILTAAFDGVPGSIAEEKDFSIYLSKDEGALLSAELMLLPGEESFGINYSKISVGGWYYTSDFGDLPNGRKKGGNFGAFINAEQFVSTESSDNEGLALFARLGFANRDFNPSDYSISVGADYIGLIPGREEDNFGLAFTSIHLTDDFTNSEKLESDFESIFELTYSLKISGWLRVQPDLQYIFYPVFAPDNHYAFIAGLRTEIVF